MEFAASTWRKQDFQNWTKPDQFSPTPVCSVCASIEDHEEIFASVVTGSHCFQPESRPLKEIIPHVKLEGGCV